MDALSCIGIVTGTFIILLAKQPETRYHGLILIMISVFTLVAF